MLRLNILMACTSVLPPTRASNCDYDINWGEISVLAITEYGDGLTDWEDEEEWNDRIDNTTAYTNQDPAPIRLLFGIGSLGSAERNTLKLSRRRSVATAPKFTIPFRVEDTGAVNWAWMRALPEGGQTFTGWAMTEDKMFGGGAGLKIHVVADPNIPESIDEFWTINVTVSFEGSVPEMATIPTGITALV